MNYKTNNSDETKNLASKIREEFPGVRVWLLYGDLAAGKTTFIKGLGESLGLDARQVKSPTYAFLKEHPDLLHYDLYRLEGEDEIIREQIIEQLEGPKFLAIEWPEHMEEHITVPHLKLHFSHQGVDQRHIRVEDYSSSRTAM